jgi:tetratricopeptide (TPR) repeat protein
LEWLNLEQYLLDCLEDLHKAGDDEVRRKNAIQRSATWGLLDKSWKPLAIMAASKEAPIVKEDSQDPSGRPRGANRSHRSRGGRRGGRDSRRGFEDNLPSPDRVLRDDHSAGFKLAVLIAQKHKMTTNWNDSWDGNLDLVRIECAQGLHPVWSRLAREAPLFAEMERFPVNEIEVEVYDSSEWIAAAHIDPEDSKQLREWLSLPPPFRLNSGQALALDKIKKDLAGKPRPQSWPKTMKEYLRELEGISAILESLILLGSKHLDSIDSLGRVGNNDSLQSLAEKHARLSSHRNGNFDEWSTSIQQTGDDNLSKAIRVEVWKNYNSSYSNLTKKELLTGLKILSEESIPHALNWRIAELSSESGGMKEALAISQKLSIENDSHLSIALKISTATKSPILEEKIISVISNISEKRVAEIMQNDNLPISIQLAAAAVLTNINDVRYTNEILSVFTRAADVTSLAEKMIADDSLALAYPFRALMVCQLISAEDALNISSNLKNLKSHALLALGESTEDDTLSEVSLSLISLLAGVPSNMDSIHQKLDTDGVVILNQVRRALSSDGDGLVKESLIESLEKSIQTADVSHLEARLFSALIDALYLNLAALGLQMGEVDKKESSIEIFEKLSGRNELTNRTIRSLDDLVVEHSIGIVSLEKWYRINDKDSAEYHVVRAAVERERGNRANAARSYKEASIKIVEDYENSSILLRKSLIEFAHAGVWDEAVEMIENNPQLMAAVTQKFQLYLHTCADVSAGYTDKATRRLIEFVSKEERTDPEFEGVDAEFNKRRKESLELLQRYPDEHNLPKEMFSGRIRAAFKTLEKSGASRQSDLERRFHFELHDKKDIFELTLLGGQIAEKKPLRGIRRFEEAIETGFFDDLGIRRLRDTQRAVFVSHSNSIPVKDRRTLHHLGLKPLILIDTNVLIDALKDDLLREISSDQYGSLDWTVERSFHMMLIRRSKGDVFVTIPPSARREFKHRTKSPDSVLDLFEGVYINHQEWEKIITPAFLKERVEIILNSFNTWNQLIEIANRDDVELEEFLLKHEQIFEMVDQYKRARSNSVPIRTELKGKEIYPENGDIEIMQDAAGLAKLPLQEIGCVLVATRDSDFRLISRALEEGYGFGVISDAQQLNSRI